MKKAILLTALAMLWAAAHAQPARDAIEANRELAGGIYYVDDFSYRPQAPAPKGYKPVYISHYGRHGARYFDSNAEFTALHNLLEDAAAKDNLTPLGRDLYEQYSKAWPLIRMRAGDLTDVGWNQHRGIADRMVKSFPRLFKGRKARVAASSTVAPRCIMSMAAFCERLQEFNPSMEISTVSSAACMGELNPFTAYNPQIRPTDEGYANKYAAWWPALKAYSAKEVDPKPFAARFFRDPSLMLKGENASKFLRYVYHIAATRQCGGFEGDFWKYLTLDEAYAKFREFNLKMYLSKGPDTLVQGGRQWAFVNYFVENLVNDTDADLASGDIAARLRFGHDITIISTLKLLDVEGWNVSARSFDEVADMWQHYRIPMASNLQFIFYRNGQGEMLVRAMLNERDLRFPIASDTAPYYRWEDFRAFALERIGYAKHIIATTKAPSKKKK